MVRVVFRLISISMLLAVTTPVLAEEVPSALLRLGDGRYYSSTAIVVDKHSRKLTVWEALNGQITKKAEFPSDSGRMEGPKIARGDKRTPEGVYFLQRLLEGPGLSFQEYGAKAFTTNYPNFFDRRDGKTGDGIWLHAVPDTVSLERGSKGCVVVRNEAIVELAKYIKLNQTPIIISDNVNYMPIDEAKVRAASIDHFVEEWRQAWESRNVDRYISFYDDSFSAMKMNKDQWRKFKQGLSEKYQSIKVNFSMPVAFEYKGRIIVRVLQKYSSDQHDDFGEKYLYLESKGQGQYKIVSEEWAPVENAEALQAMVGSPTTAQAN